MKFNKVEDERCPKASHPTLAGVYKAPVESKEGERIEKTRKRKRAGTTKEPKEPAPITVPKEEATSEEMGDFEAYVEQSMLSLIADQGESAQIRAKEKGKQRAETEDSKQF